MTCGVRSLGMCRCRWRSADGRAWHAEPVHDGLPLHGLPEGEREICGTVAPAGLASSCGARNDQRVHEPGMPLSVVL